MKKLSIFNYQLSIALLVFLSACRSAHSVSKVAESAQTTETSLTSAVTSTTLTDFISAISLQADSIVMWVQSEPSSRTPVFQDLPDSTLDAKGSFKSNNSGLQSTKSSRNANAPDKSLVGLPSAAAPLNGIKVYGLHLNSSTVAENKCSLQTEDSLSSKAKNSSAFEEREKSKPPACAYAQYFIYGAIATAIAIAIALIRRKMKK